MCWKMLQIQCNILIGWYLCEYLIFFNPVFLLESYGIRLQFLTKIIFLWALAGRFEQKNRPTVKIIREDCCLGTPWTSQYRVVDQALDFFLATTCRKNWLWNFQRLYYTWFPVDYFYIWIFSVFLVLFPAPCWCSQKSKLRWWKTQKLFFTFNQARTIHRSNGRVRSAWIKSVVASSL